MEGEETDRVRLERPNCFLPARLALLFRGRHPRLLSLRTSVPVRGQKTCPVAGGTLSFHTVEDPLGQLRERELPDSPRGGFLDFLIGFELLLEGWST